LAAGPLPGRDRAPPRGVDVKATPRGTGPRGPEVSGGLPGLPGPPQGVLTTVDPGSRIPEIPEGPPPGGPGDRWEPSRAPGAGPRGVDVKETPPRGRKPEKPPKRGYYRQKAHFWAFWPKIAIFGYFQEKRPGSYRAKKAPNAQKWAFSLKRPKISDFGDPGIPAGRGFTSTPRGGALSPVSGTPGGGWILDLLGRPSGTRRAPARLPGLGPQDPVPDRGQGPAARGSSRTPRSVESLQASRPSSGL